MVLSMPFRHNLSSPFAYCRIEEGKLNSKNIVGGLDPRLIVNASTLVPFAFD